VPIVSYRSERGVREGASVTAHTVLTIGHSTHPEDRFVALLRRHRVEAIADVRRFPSSRRLPHFNADHLEALLSRHGIHYERLGDELGGRRKAAPDSPNAGWRVKGFRAYADHMATPEFEAGMGRLERLADERRTAMMCAEGPWWRCHRQLVADAMLARGWRVVHVMPDGSLEDHRLTPFAVVEGGRIAYPGEVRT
jgi:uncharacterized protein (DUF488 family)